VAVRAWKTLFIGPSKRGFNAVKTKAVLVILAFYSGSVFATNYSGPVLDVRMQASSTTPGSTRISVLTNVTTGCTQANWFAYEFADTGVGKTWTAAFLAALASGRLVFIGGTGTCDSSGVETIYYVDSV
jgi:hypothetical protein